MDDVAGTMHLIRRGAVWYYQRRLPERLAKLYGRTIFKKSLKTTDLAKAKKLRTREDVAFDALLEHLESQISGHATKTVGASAAELTTAQIQDFARNLVASRDDAAKKRELLDPPIDDEDQKERADIIRENIDFLKQPGGPNGEMWVSSEVDKAMKQFPNHSENPELANVVRRSLLELNYRSLARLFHDTDRTHYDSLFDPEVRPDLPFNQLAQLFIDERLKDYELNGVNQKRADKTKYEVSTIVEIVGEKTMTSTIDDDTVQLVRNVLAEFPANRNKIYPDMQLAKALEIAKKEQARTLSPVTQARYLDCFRDLLRVAVRKKYLPSNPAFDAKPIQKDKVAAEDKRKPWTDAQIKGFFEGEFYKSCASSSESPYSKFDRPWRFWIPLLMLYSGARPEEIAQLTVSDLKQTPKGTWYLDLQNENAPAEQKKKLKTLSSLRRIPLHPELGRLGFHCPSSNDLERVA